MRALLHAFIELPMGRIRDSIDLREYTTSTGKTLTNAIVQEVCVMIPSLVALDLTDCTSVSDTGLWCAITLQLKCTHSLSMLFNRAIARHCTALKRLNLRGLDEITSVGLRSLGLRCSDLEVLDLSGEQRIMAPRELSDSGEQGVRN
jgi:hypothetical protein